MRQKIEFDDARALSFRKRLEVLAFRSADQFCFQKNWGDQNVRKEGWIIVPLSENGEPTDDIYGVDSKVFEKTYESSPSMRPNRYRKTETVRAYKPGCPFEVDTVLSDGHMEVVGSKAESYDAWIVRASSGEVYPIENTEFKRTYVEVPVIKNGYRIRSRDEHWAADGTPKRILTLDGGGVRGMLSLGYLQHIENLLRLRHGGSSDFRLSHYFDLIAGTSTGAIIAAGLAKGMTVQEIKTKYQSLAKSIFKGSLFRQGKLRARYSSKQLKKALWHVFRENTLGSLAIQTGLLVVAKRLDTGSVWPMSNNPKNSFFTASPNDSFFPNEDYLLRRVVRASTAAPSYFAPEFIEISQKGDQPHGEFVDGGMSPHNNPALLALQYATLKGFGACWDLDPDKLLLVSVGTGSAQPGTTKSWLAGKHAINSLISLIDDCAEFVEIIMQWFSSSPTARNIDAAMKDLGSDLLAERPLLHYLRYNIQLEQCWLEENLQKIMNIEDILKLQQMDHPDNMDTLHELGIQAAKKQILNQHFPARFDLGD